MYAKIANTSHEDAEAFAKTAIEEMKKERGDYEVKRVSDRERPKAASPTSSISIHRARSIRGSNG